MKTTRYFDRTRERSDRLGIRLEWVQRAIEDPVAQDIQADGRIRRWAKIDEAGGRFLRVVFLQDGETVHNAFFDRGYNL